MLLRGILTAVMMVAGLAAGATAAAGQSDVEMTTDQAGTAYLQAACRSIRAQDEFDRKIWHGRDRIGFAEVRLRLPALKRASGAYGRALNKSARLLYNPQAGSWPTSVASDVRTVANADAKESYWRMQQASAPSADAWLRFNGRANNISIGMASTRIRAILDLPPPGEGC